ncbi:MAG: hypothetical protein Q8M31_18455 [Beijerinckiaceae bacterium]|nr:hypothetical protein [Beijerinckiaceae bacterium]
MAIEQQSFLYEVLIRGAADGSIAGAHQIHAERIVDTETGAVLAEKIMDAKPLALADVASLLAESFVTDAAVIAALQMQVATLTGELEEARASRDAAAPGGPKPGSVSNIQLRKAVNQVGLRDAIEAHLKTAPHDLRDLWDWSESISVDAPEIIAACAALGITDQQRTAIFEAAAAL